MKLGWVDSVASVHCGHLEVMVGGASGRGPEMVREARGASGSAATGLRPRREEGRTMAGGFPVLRQEEQSCDCESFWGKPLVKSEQNALMAADSIKSSSHYCTVNY